MEAKKAPSPSHGKSKNSTTDPNDSAVHDDGNEGSDTDGNDNNKEERNRRRRTANWRSEGSATKITGENTGGNCDNHTIADLTSKGFNIMPNTSYLKWKRKVSMTGYENIVNRCYDCGVVF